MSSSITPKVEPGTAGSTSDTTALNFNLDDRVLRIEHPGGDATRLKWKIKRLKGSPPREGPAWRSCAHTYADHRDLAPLTLQFKSKEPDNIFADRKAQDGVRRALWATLEQLLDEAGCEVEKALPRVSFDELRQPQTQPLGLIDLVFSSAKALECVHKKLKEIHLEIKGKKRTFNLHRDTNALPSNVFAFDCLNLPLDDVDTNDLFAAFSSMTEELGSLLGIAKIVVCSADGSSYSDSGTARAYIGLKKSWMRAPMKEVAAQLPTSFVWYGKLHKLLYLGVDTHAEPKESADYPLSSDEEEGGGDSETSEASDSSDSEDEDGKARKKRKMERE